MNNFLEYFEAVCYAYTEIENSIEDERRLKYSYILHKLKEFRNNWSLFRKLYKKSDFNLMNTRNLILSSTKLNFRNCEKMNISFVQNFLYSVILE